MTPYVSIVYYTREDEDEPTCFFRTSYPATEKSEQMIYDIPLSPVQRMLMIQELSRDFPLDRIDNG